MKYALLFIIPLLFSIQADATETTDIKRDNYIKAKAKNGDGIYAILNRYQLQRASCNYQKFLDLNKITIHSKIYRDKEYLIPIIEYQYDGKSINSSIKRDDSELAEEIKTYNKKMYLKKLKSDDFIADKNLWVPHHLMLCDYKSTSNNSKTNKAAAAKKTIKKKDALFGKDNELYELIDNSLKGEVYYIISGHGGPDPGAIHNPGSASCLCEDEYAYDVSLRLVKNLKQRGATVHMIIQDKNDGIRNGKILRCDRDEKCLNEGSIPLNQLKRLQQRVKSVNDLHAKYRRKGVKSQKVIVVHVDSRPKGQRQDVFFLYSKGSKSGKKLANNLLNTFAMKYKKHRKNGNYDGEIVPRNLYVLRNTRPTAVYVELANIKNPTDQKRITKADNRQALADWLYEGVIQ